MAQLGEFTAKINFEMTETSKAVLKNELLKILQEPDVLKELLQLLTQASRLEAGLHGRRTET